ncbi:dsRBD fold-containing protein [Streptomyces sp. NPDC097617]|uniref:dsRBD fold-containing protein n=1 Tax=Streptomyces sp. NPDC097617 TaxID=3366091 RepID=UPI0037F45B2D
MSHTTEWKTRVYLFEEDHTTKVRVELDTGTSRLTGHGTARGHPTDNDVPEIGDELAAARALENLAAQLKLIAYHDMIKAGSAPEELSPTAYGGWMDSVLMR